MALVATLGFSAIGLTQCRMVDNNVTGVDVDNAYHGNRGRSACVHRCEDAYKLCNRREDSRYCKAVSACDRLRKTADRKACKEAEKRKHDQNQRECVRLKEKCKKDCAYQEGNGHGGR